MKNKKIIIFDLDGTLYKLRGGSFLNSNLYKKILDNAKIFISKKLEVSKNEAEKEIKKIMHDYGENISIALEEKYKINRYDYFNYVWDVNPKYYVKRSKCLEGVLTRLNKDYDFLLMSDSPQIWINNVLGYLKITAFFQGKILSGEGSKRKIFGNRYDDILLKYKLDPKNVFVIGDQENTDIIPAKKLGINTIFLNQFKKSNQADYNISDLNYLETILSVYSDGFADNNYFKAIFDIIDIENNKKIKIYKGSTDSAIVGYGKTIYKSGSRENLSDDLIAYDNFKKVLGKKYKKIFSEFKVLINCDDLIVYKTKNEGEYSLEDYLLSPNKQNKKILSRLNDVVLNDLDEIYNSSNKRDYNIANKFYSNLLRSLEFNLKKAGYPAAKSRELLEKLGIIGQNKPVENVSLLHNDLTTGNIVVRNNMRSIYFIDPRLSPPNCNNGLDNAFGNIALDLVGYYLSVIRKEMEGKKNNKECTTLNIKKNIEQKIDQYIEKNATSQLIIDICFLFWYSVYLSCNCEYCLSPNRKWLYDKMKDGYNLYIEKIDMHFSKLTRG